MSPMEAIDLPGLNCGLCGYRTCDELAARLKTKPAMIKRCIHLSEDHLPADGLSHGAPCARPAGSAAAACSSCGPCAGALPMAQLASGTEPEPTWRDSVDRDFDFYLEHFPEEPGPREIIIPHNPILTRELDIQVGDVLIGRPLGMSCGCPITHCGVATNVDQRTGVLSWCVTGPLRPRQEGFKDLGYYIAEGYEGLVHQARCELKIGMRYYFQPRMCMLQWRHSGLLNYLNRTGNAMQVRLEGLWIG